MFVTRVKFVKESSTEKEGFHSSKTKIRIIDILMRAISKKVWYKDMEGSPLVKKISSFCRNAFCNMRVMFMTTRSKDLVELSIPTVIAMKETS